MIDALIEHMKELVERMEAANDPKRIFHATYYDLPQALLAVITDEEFDDAELIARREADH